MSISMSMENTTSIISYIRLAPLHGTLEFVAIGNILISSSLFLTLAMIFFYLTKFHKLKYQKAKQLPLPPGPRPWPLVGSFPTMLTNKPTYKWIHKLMKEMNTEIACIRLGNVHVIPVTSPEISREFLKSQDANFTNRPLSISTHLVTRGYVTTTLVPLGEQWKKMKRVLVTQVLSPPKFKWLHGKRTEEADHLVRYKVDEEGGLVDVRLTRQHYYGNVIRKMVFNKRFFGEGMQDGGPGVEEKEHVDALFTALSYLYAFCVSDYLPCLIGLDLDGHEKVMKGYHDPIIEERVQQWKDGTKKEVNDLLDVLISLKDANGNSLLSLEEIKAQITDIILAAVDNPSNALEWALAEMINQPKLLEKATEELDIVVGKERLVQESDFLHLNYMKACAREAFRLHPISAFNIPRVSIVDTTVANYFIPKGSHVLLSRYGLGRNPKIWDEPHRFKPERHLKNDRSHVTLMEPDLNFISFSTGKRGCTGVALGSSMTVMLFARLLQGFSWSVPHNGISIELTECKNSLALAKPLVALAKPRLPAHLYVPCLKCFRVKSM